MAWLGFAFEHEADHGEPGESGDRPRVALEIARPSGGRRVFKE